MNQFYSQIRGLLAKSPDFVCNSSEIRQLEFEIELPGFLVFLPCVRFAAVDLKSFVCLDLISERNKWTGSG